MSEKDVSNLSASVDALSVGNLNNSNPSSENNSAKPGGASEASAVPKSIFNQVSDVNNMKTVAELANYIKLQEYEALLAKEMERMKKKQAKAGNPGKDHKFWDTQPMAQIGEKVPSEINEALDKNTDVENVQREPYPMPAGYAWCELDVNDDEELSELYKLLTENYVEDDEAMFRFDYSKEFLLWALTVPGYLKAWHIGVRAPGKDGKKGKLMGSITGIPVDMNVHGKTHIPMVEINFLCVHKKLREKRLAPVLIKEITRRVHLTGRWQAVYTAGVMLPGCKAICRYYHRNIQVKKLCDIRFSYCPKGKTMKDHCAELALPKNPKHPMRPMTEADVPQVLELLNTYLTSLKLSQTFTLEDVRHLFLPRPRVMCSYVLEDAAAGLVNGVPKVTDFCSFYHLPSSIMNNPEHKTLHAVYAYYNVARTMSFEELMHDALVLAQKEGADVFNALDLMQNAAVFDVLKFGKGDGNLHYYVYNWNCASVQPNEVGLVLV